MPVGTRLPLVSSSVSLANRRGLQKILVRSRIATFGRLFEGTDEISLGQTSPCRCTNRHKCYTGHAFRGGKKLAPGNVAERLALAQKTVSFCQCRFDNETATNNEVRMPTQSRAHSAQHHCDEPARGVLAGRQQSDDGCPVSTTCG
jgi:hypothetical protein